MQAVHLLPLEELLRVFASLQMLRSKITPSVHTSGRFARPIRSRVISVTKATMEAVKVDQSLNPILASVKPSKTIAFTDMAMQLKEQGVDVRL